MGWGVCLDGIGRLARIPGVFQSSVSVLRLGASKFVHMFIKSGVLVSYIFLVLLALSPTGFQNLLRGLIFPGLDARAGVPNVGLELLTP